ncbi:L-histidine N(alpha)-methyltransferase [Longibacter salinarum]|uniref:L-histidine N(Alpha)-methyltransferase n=1 Tax=Longibacter salinarum TaxID=1850348 RepID=A0A2A8D140_9BACT|nr:L-histidine N(alpha)-methyltransferase [Longibacter salinarum]PEN14600.1 L-histidine N(alpha)-methyltransferase [Longibacter salinarum]
MNSPETLSLIDCHPSESSFREDVLDGLSREQKQIASKYLYDARGSKLFDRITTLEEYYPTRTEASIMRTEIDAMAEAIGKDTLLVEYGSGSSEKTRILLDRVSQNLQGYVPVDISRDHLMDAAARIASSYPDLDVRPVCADYTSSFPLPEFVEEAARIVVYFPGSTIGNFERDDAVAFLDRIAQAVGAGGGLLIGVDLRKDPDILHAAYNDREGVTARFNLNLLRRINRELNADFDLDAFRHEAVWRSDLGCIEMLLVSTKDQSVRVGEETFSFEKGESIHTEYSFKFTPEQFAEMASEAGFRIERVWTDDQDLFSIQYATVGAW